MNQAVIVWHYTFTSQYIWPYRENLKFWWHNHDNSIALNQFQVSRKFLSQTRQASQSNLSPLPKQLIPSIPLISWQEKKRGDSTWEPPPPSMQKYGILFIWFGIYHKFFFFFSHISFDIHYSRHININPEKIDNIYRFFHVRCKNFQYSF